MSIKTLEQLQKAQLPRLIWKDVAAIKRVSDGNDHAKLDAYFRQFAPPSETCIACGRELWFQWSIRHGEGVCAQRGCGYRARAYHYDLFNAGRLTIVLQYHPDELRRTAEMDDESAVPA